MGDSTSTRVDLGLSALLSDSPLDANPAEKAVVQGVADVDQVSAPVEQSAFEQLASNGDWPAIVRLAESELALNDDPETRLWWIRGHLESFTMPVSFLAAPLESVCRGLTVGGIPDRVFSPLRETGRRVMHRLSEVGDREHMASLKVALDSVGAYDDHRSSPLSTEIPIAKELVGSAAFGSPLNGQATGSTGAARGSALLPRRSKSIGLWAFVATLLIGAGFAGFHLSKPYLVPQAVFADEAFVSGEVPLELVMPALDRRDPVGSLSALFYSIDGNQPPAPEQQPGPDAAPTGVQARSGETSVPDPGSAKLASSLAGNAKPNQKEDRSRRRPKEKVNTSRPIEGAEFKQRKKAPILDDASDPRLVMERRPSGADGSGVYRVIVSTRVLSSPSYTGRFVGVLEEGDRVYVEARLGRWVRIRSRRGKSGFVLAQDLAEREWEEPAALPRPQGEESASSQTQHDPP